MGPGRAVDDPPLTFQRAVESLRSASRRPEVVFEEVPAPQRLAPYAMAVSADVVVGTEELATGRLVLLHDPEGQPAWQGSWRIVTFARADVEPDLAGDPLLTAVGWAWLVEALTADAGPDYGADAGPDHGADAVPDAGPLRPTIEDLRISGTVTRVSSESFGGLAGRESSAELEVRASWSPPPGFVGRSVTAWCSLLCTMAGLPPVAPGVAPLRPRRARPR